MMEHQEFFSFVYASGIMPLDIYALLYFIVAWAGYGYFATHHGNTRANLLMVTNYYRTLWMQEMLKRENRTMDSIMVGNLQRSIAFFANTTIFILLGLMTMLGYSDKISTILSSIPFAQHSSGFIWELKIFLLIFIFIYAFFKYTWSLRQYNYAGIFVNAAPPCRERTSEHAEIALQGSQIVTSAAKHFNLGLRAYYFGLAALGWFIHSWFFIVATTWVVMVVYRHEFRSGTLRSLARSVADQTQ